MFNHISVAFSLYNRYKLTVKMCFSHLFANHVNIFGKKVSFLIAEIIFSQFRNAFRGINFPKLGNLFLVFQKKNTMKEICLPDAFSFSERIAIYPYWFLFGKVVSAEIMKFYFILGYRQMFKIPEQRKKYNCISATTSTVYCKGLNSIIMKEVWMLFRWRLKGRNAFLSEMSKIIELLSHRGKSVLYKVPSKNLFVGFKIQMPLECQTYISSKERKTLLEY